MKEYGTNIVAGVTPGRGGASVEGVPVFDGVAEAVKETGAEASVFFVPARAVKDTVFETLEAGIKLKKAGHPFGFELGHGFGDNHGWLYPLLWSYGVTVMDKDGKKVALVGAGPSSLTVANDLMPLGYQCTVFEKGPRPGGLMRINIPAFRLPAQVLDEEIGYVIGMGADLRLLDIASGAILGELKLSGPVYGSVATDGTNLFVLQDCSTASGVCTSSDASWSKAISAADKKWVWRVDGTGMYYLSCTATVTNGTANEHITVSGMVNTK